MSAYFGGKSSVAGIVWAALGDVKHYLEPFFGSGAVLLARPDYRPGMHIETVCEIDPFLANVWRALQFAPDKVARWCDWPVSHVDMSARKRRLLAERARLQEHMARSERACNPRLAGYWIWMASCWIGSGMTERGHGSAFGQRPHLTASGMGVHKLGQIPDLAGSGKGVQEPYNINLYSWFRALSERIRYVWLVCGDWSRVCGGDWQDNCGDVGLFFDPPYGEAAKRAAGLYHHDSLTVAGAVRDWCLERGARPTYRIVLAGYTGEHECLAEHGWRVHHWVARGGYAHSGDGQGKRNRKCEVLWFSPHCLDSTARQRELF